MKLTKSGEIEACCEWSRENALMLQAGAVSYGLSKERGFFRNVFHPSLYFESEHSTKAKLDLKELRIFYCPNCGAKTEIEGE